MSSVYRIPSGDSKGQTQLPFRLQTLVVLSSCAANAPEVVRSLRRRKPGEMLAGMTTNPNVLRGPLLALPIPSWGLPSSSPVMGG